MRSRTVLLALRASAALWVLAGVPLGAQTTYEAPRFSYGEGKIGLVEAVRLTLAHDPNLLLQREDVRFQQGIVEELAGAFDWQLSIDASYDYREQELRNSVIQRERDKRDELTLQNEFTCAQVPSQQEKIDLLEDALAGATIDPNNFDDNTDAFFQAQLAFLQQRIATTTNPLELQALLTSREALLSRELLIAQGTRNEFQKLCDDTGQSLARLGSIPEFEEFETGRVRLGLQKLFRSGISLAPFLEASFDSTQFKGKKNGFFEPRLDENGQPVETEFGTPLLVFVDFGGKNVEDLYKAEVGFDLNLPLLRGRGVESVAAGEKAAAVDLEATGLALRHGASVSALNTALTYWSLLAAQDRVVVLERSVDLQSRIGELTDQLIEGEVLPRVERSRTLAGQANSRSQLEGARRDLVSARLALARAMGLDVEGEGNAPLAEGPFPAAPSLEAVRALDVAALAERAVGVRFDRQATHLLVESGRILSEAARRDLADRLDLQLGVSAGALGEGSFSEAIDRWTGPSGAIAIAYERDLGNHSRQGRLGQRESLVRQREISAGDLDRGIRIGVVQTLRSLEESVARLIESEAAAGFFQETIDAEFEKLRAGASTLIDALLTEQQRTSADLALLSARQQVAVLLAQLRFETGTLVEGEEGGGSVWVERLTTLPDEASSAGSANGAGGLP